jgi:hypothetical protein
MWEYLIGMALFRYGFDFLKHLKRCKKLVLETQATSLSCLQICGIDKFLPPPLIQITCLYMSFHDVMTMGEIYPPFSLDKKWSVHSKA